MYIVAGFIIFILLFVFPNVSSDLFIASKTTCSDTDETIYPFNIDQVGQVIIKNAYGKILRIYTDTCSGTKYHKEYYCNKNSARNKKIKCPNQERCIYGVCGGDKRCALDWRCTPWGYCIDGSQTRTCTDANSCGTNTNKPITTQQCSMSCTPSWQCGAWSSCVNNQQSRLCFDTNNCGTTANRPSLTQSCIITQ